MHTQPHLVLSMPPKSLTSRELAQARTVSSSRRISTSASAPSVSALVAQHRIDDDNDDEDNNVAESQAPASRNHLARLDALSARAGRPPTVNAQGKRIAPNPDAYVARHQTESNTIGKRRFGAGITLLSNQGGVNVRDFIEEQVVISLQPKDNENPSTRKHRLQTLMLWDEFIKEAGVPSGDRWLPAVVKTYATAFLRVRVSRSSKWIRPCPTLSNRSCLSLDGTGQGLLPSHSLVGCTRSCIASVNTHETRVGSNRESKC